jgi:hypothetical protein
MFVDVTVFTNVSFQMKPPKPTFWCGNCQNWFRWWRKPILSCRMGEVLHLGEKLKEPTLARWGGAVLPRELSHSSWQSAEGSTLWGGKGGGLRRAVGEYPI